MLDDKNCSHLLRFLHQLVHSSAAPAADTAALVNPPSSRTNPDHTSPTVSSGNNTSGVLSVDDYDYHGALFFVVGLLSMYGLCILLLIISLIRKSRTELELFDHLRDFEAMRRASQKKGLPIYNPITMDEAEEENGDQNKAGYRSIRPDPYPGDDGDHSDIMSVSSRATRKARRDSFIESRVSSVEITSVDEDLFSDSSSSPLQKDPQILCMYCAKRISSSGECHNCEQQKLQSPGSPVSEFGFSKRRHSDFRTCRKQFVDQDPPKYSEQPASQKRLRFARYHSVDSTHHRTINADTSVADTVTDQSMSNSSKCRKLFTKTKPSKQSSMAQTDAEDMSTSGSQESTGRSMIRKPPFGNSVTSRTYNPVGLQRNSRWLALKALYMERGSLCSADVEENIAEEDEQDLNVQCTG